MSGADSGPPVSGAGDGAEFVSVDEEILEVRCAKTREGEIRKQRAGELRGN